MDRSDRALDVHSSLLSSYNRGFVRHFFFKPHQFCFRNPARANLSPILSLPGPLPLFIFFLVILGFSLSFFLTPTMQDLSVVIAMTPGLPSTAAYGCFNMVRLSYCRFLSSH